MTDSSTPPGHALDAMLALQPREPGVYEGHTHAGYWNMVGPYGGATAALMRTASCSTRTAWATRWH